MDGSRLDMKKIALLFFCSVCASVYILRQNANYTVEQDGGYVFMPEEREAFIKRITSDTGMRHDFWVSIDVESPEYNGKAVIESSDLYSYFINTQNVDRTESKEIMYRILKEKSMLRIEKVGDFAKFRFRIVSSDAAVIAYAQKRVNYIVKTNYIETLGINKTREAYAAISMLYDINIAAKRDCESGYFIIYKYDRADDVMRTCAYRGCYP